MQPHEMSSAKRLRRGHAAAENVARSAKDKVTIENWLAAPR
jgi:hypothetical protein